MILLFAVLVGLVVGFASGGSLAGFGRVRLRALPLLFAGLAVQFAIFTQIAGRSAVIHRYGPYIHIATLLLTWFVMTRNVHVPGMKIIALGAALNLLVIIANGGFMPSPASALTDAGKIGKMEAKAAKGDRAVLSNSTVAADDAALLWDRDTPLLILGDIFAVPRGWPLANVFSIGDVLIGLGASVAIVRVMRTRAEDEDADAAAPELRETAAAAGDPLA